MNAPIRKFAAVLAVFVAAAGLTACASSFDTEADLSSPLAPHIQTLVDANRGYPRWEDFPKSLQPAPEPAMLAARVGALSAAGGSLAEEAARIEWTLTGDPTAFAADAQARVDAVEVAPVTQQTQSEIEEFVRRTRERGTAPPPVDRR